MKWNKIVPAAILAAAVVVVGIAVSHRLRPILRSCSPAAASPAAVPTGEPAGPVSSSPAKSPSPAESGLPPEENGLVPAGPDDAAAEKEEDGLSPEILGREVEKNIPHAYALERRRPVRALSKAAVPLTGGDREIAQNLIAGERGFYENLDSFEFDLRSFRSSEPDSEISGHVVCDKPDAFVFDGRLGAKDMEARVEWEKGKGVLILKKAQLETRRQFLPDFSELEEILWQPEVRKEGYVDTFDAVRQNQEIKNSEDQAVSCTVLCRGNARYYFENATGRMLRAEMGQRRVLTFSYDRDVSFPRKMEATDLSTGLKIVNEYNNLKVKRKP